jgi:hypothetical protein
MSIMEFSEISPKIRKISLSAAKMTYDSIHGVWDETDLIYCDIKLAENGRVDLNERARMEVHSTIFDQMGFSQTSVRPDKFRSNEVGSKIYIYTKNRYQKLKFR